jgi:aminoglycoside phosphotransferase (APT) family kinase protein
VLKDFSSIASLEERAAIQYELARVLAALHRVDVKSVGLEDYGSEGNYYRRQLKVKIILLLLCFVTHTQKGLERAVGAVKSRRSSKHGCVD